MSRTYIFDLYELQDQIRQLLRPHIGVAADVINVLPLLVAGFESSLSATNNNTYAIQQILSDLGIPSDIQSRVAAQMCDHFYKLIEMSVGKYDANSQYTYMFHGLSDFLVTISDRPKDAEPDASELLIKKIQEDIANGDWYNEKYRRIAGL